VKVAAQLGIAIALLAFGARVGGAEPAEPWIGVPAFSVAPADLMAGVASLPVPDASAEVLLEEMRLTFDDSSSTEQSYHTIYRVLNASGVDSRSHFSITWSPWRQARPTVRARVISADGATHELDPATIADAPVGGQGEALFSDRLRPGRA
jgi:hypothetical protein